MSTFEQNFDFFQSFLLSQFIVSILALILITLASVAQWKKYFIIYSDKKFNEGKLLLQFLKRKSKIKVKTILFNALPVP